MDGGARRTGRGETVADLLAAWEEHGANIEQLLASPHGSRASAVVMDVNCHECDLRHALGLVPRPDPGFLDWAAPSLLGGFVKAVEAQSLPPVTVDAPPFEVFRGRLGRRTGAEVAGYAWSADPTEYLDAWFIFGRATSRSARPRRADSRGSSRQQRGDVAAQFVDAKVLRDAHPAHVAVLEAERARQLRRRFGRRVDGTLSAFVATTRIGRPTSIR